MKHVRCGGALLLVAVMTTTAWAQDPPAAAEPAAAPAAAPAEPPKFAGGRTVYFLAGSVSDSPFLFVGSTFAPGVTLAVGANFHYDGNGLPGPTGMPTSDKLEVQGLLYGAYYVYNKFPVGVAVETSVIAPLSPQQFDVLTFRPGVAIYYAPFPVPLVVGTALDVQINVFRGDLSALKPQVSTLTPGLRLIYVFP